MADMSALDKETQKALIKKMTKQHASEWIFQGDKIFWALLADGILAQESNGKPMGGFSNADWDAFQNLLRKEGKELIGLIDSNSQFKEVRKLFERSKKVALNKYTDALNAFVTQGRGINKSVTDAPEEHQLYWDSLLEWAKRNTGVVGADRPIQKQDIQRQLSVGSKGIFERSEVIEVPDLQEIVSKAYSSKGLWKLQSKIGAGAYESGKGDYPAADISDAGIRAITEIRPTPNETEKEGLPLPLDVLQANMQNILYELKKNGAETMEVFSALVSLWWQKSNSTGINEGWARITVDEVCEWLNLSRRSDRQSAFSPKVYKRVQNHLKLLSRISVTILDVPSKNKTSQQLLKLKESAISIQPLTKQKEQQHLWLSDESYDEEWIEVNVSVGLYCRWAIGDGNEWMPPPRVTGLDPRLQVEKMLGWFFAWLIRANAKGSSILKVKVGRVLETCGLRKESVSKERLERALDKLVELGDPIRNWQYLGDSIDELVMSRGEETGVITRMSQHEKNRWLESQIQLEASSGLIKQYEKLALTHQEHKKTEVATPKNLASSSLDGLREEVRRMVGHMYGGNQSRAAESIGITASSLSRYLKGLRIRDDGKLKKWLDRGGTFLSA